MKKRIQALVLLAAMLLSLIGCEDIDPDTKSEIPNITYTPEQIYAMYDAHEKMYLYELELPTGKDYGGYDEFEYTVIDQLTGETEYDYITETFVTYDGGFGIPVIHWKNERHYSKHTGIYPDKTTYEYDAFQYVTPSLLIFSPDTLDYEIVEFETIISDHTSLPEDRIAEILQDGKTPPTNPMFPESLTPTSDGGFAAYYTVSAKSGSAVPLAQLYRYAKWDSSGTRVMTVKPADFPYTMPANDFVIANNGNIYYRFKNEISVMSPDCVHLYSIDLPSGVSQIKLGLDADKNAILTFTTRQVNSSRYAYSVIDDGTQSLGEPTMLPESLKTTPYFAPGYEVYYVNSIGIFGVDSGKEPECLAAWSDYNLAYKFIENVEILSSDRICVAAVNPLTNAPEMYCITSDRIDGKTPKVMNWDYETIKTAYAKGSDTKTVKMIEDYVAVFNLASRDYRAELVSYASEGDLSVNNVLIQELIAGDAPDMIVFDSDISPESFAGLGILCDLYEWIDDDSEYDRDSFLPCVLTAIENSDGELPYLTMDFSLSAMIGSKDTIGDGTFSSIDSLIALSEQLKDGTALLTVETQKYFMTPESVSAIPQSDIGVFTLKSLLPDMLNRYVDYESGTFDGIDSLRQLLAFCRDISIYPSKTIHPGIFEDDYAALMTGEITMVHDFMSLHYAYFDGDDLNFIGYPTGDSSKAVIIPETCLAITKQSKIQKGAWEFIKFCLDYQQIMWTNIAVNELLNQGACFPCTYAAVDCMFDAVNDYYFITKVTDTGFDHNIGYVYVNTTAGARKSWSYEHGTLPTMGQPGYYFFHLTEADETALRELLGSAATVRSYDSELLSIIYEDASYYFAGTKSLEETVKIINKRVQTRLSE